MEGLSAAESGATASDVGVREDAPMRYVVKKGDTLWGISQKFLVEPWQWPEVWIVNDQVKNPHLIYPGDVLTLIWRHGRPQVERELPSDRASPRIRESDLSSAIPAIPLDAIRDFLHSPRLVTMDQIKQAPYILDFVDLHIVGADGNGAYVRKLKRSHGTTLEAVRLGPSYIDPDSNEVLGYEAIPVAQAEVREFAEPGTIVLTKSYREARAGDYLIKPLLDTFESNFYPHMPPKKISGRILSVFDGVSQIGQFQVVTLSKGARDGLEAGHVLDVLQAGRSAKDPHGVAWHALPETYAGQIMVFKTEDRVSYALVMSAIRPIHAKDRTVNPGSHVRLD
ncbi:LysM peptidoglycan-binding domain-containing protein [Solimonas sp. K1W22B-7]|uniref:LysM peptidoglycan-binding domain-containing protein n=1 Tax=Solimonas sp. K1W22B-7 TaxID=2303331 RepID=UPI0013C408B7|nr:LysM domain-containing protein [Solimonas sp. K1W22B-7]